MDDKQLPADLEACQQLIATLQSRVDKQATELSLKDKLVQEQAHSVLQLKASNDKLDEKNIELQLKVEKLLQQLFGRKSERRIDGAGQLFLDLGEEATPEVVSALEEAVREAEQIVESAEEEKKNRGAKRPGKGDRKFPAHLPRIERIIDLPEDRKRSISPGWVQPIEFALATRGCPGLRLRFAGRTPGARTGH